MTQISFLLMFLFLNCSDIPAPKAEVYKVIAISDGDTFTVLHNSKPMRIRVDAIDAPEKGMPFSKVSKQFLSKLCFGKPVSLKIVKTDRYGRWVSRVLLADGRDVSAEMIKNGMAWHYKKYSSDRKLAALELLARKRRAGLWKDNDPVAPWEVRSLHRKGISTKKRFEGYKN